MNDERCCAGCLEEMCQGRDGVVGGEEEGRVACGVEVSTETRGRGDGLPIFANANSLIA